MKKFKRILAITLSILILCGIVTAGLVGRTGTSGFLTTASAASSLKYGNENGITRAEWLYDLTEVFDMTAEEEYLPDNYFSDLEETHKYYDAILEAVQYGVIDIPAGEELKPDEYVTRDFAASTLNFCLGYQPEEDAEYTFTDIDAVTSADSAQIALNRQWFALIDGAFSPETLVTSAQVKTMLDDAAAVLEKQTVDAGYESTYEFTDDVIVLPDSVTATEDVNGVVSITDCPETIAVGDKFAVYYNGIPVAYTAKTVSVEGDVTVIETESVETEEAFTEIDAQGVIDSSAMEIIPAEGVDVTVDESSSGISTFAVKKMKTLTAELPITAGGITGKISVKIENPYIDYSTSSTGGFVTLNGETTVTYSISASMAQAAGLNKGFTLFTVNIMGVGSFDVTVMVDFSGTASGTVKGFLTAGVEFEKDVGFRAIRNFLQHEAYTSVEAAAKVSLRASLGVTKMPVIKAYIYAEVGVKANFSKKTHADDKTPHQCTHFAAYLFAEYGASASAKIGWVSYGDTITNTIYNESNSPMRVVNHYEDGKLVAKCTRGTSYSNFFTKYNSRWGGCGWSSANGAYGLTADGSYFALYDYTLNENNEATITKYNGNAWSVNIPKEIDGYTVVAIGRDAFAYKDVGYVVIPDAVTSIGDQAFYYATYLKSVTLPSGLISLGERSFQGCSSLEQITIPNGITQINAYSFSQCISLTDVTLPSNLTYIGFQAFAYTNINEIFIPKSLDACGGFTGPFQYCEKLKTVTFENGTTQIPEFLFAYCTGLEEINIPETVTVIKRGAFYSATSLKNVNLLDNLTLIEEKAFEGCASLERVNIPNSVTEVQACAFMNCNSLKTITLSKGLEYIGFQAFAYTPVETIEIPESLDRCGGLTGPFYYCNKLKTVTFENGATQIPEYVFAYCTGLEKIEIPDTVTIVEEGAFYNATALNDIKISNACTIIDERSFERCSSLKQISLPNSVIKVNPFAFSECTSLKNIELSKNLTYMGSQSFSYTAVEAIEIPKSLIECGGMTGPFFYCADLKTVTFEEGRTVIPAYIFAYCTGLQEIEIPSTVTGIEQYAFYNATALKNISLPDGLLTIGAGCFQECTDLEKMSLPNTVEMVSHQAFENCIALSEFSLSDKVSEINPSTFKNCKSLKSITLPTRISKIGSEAFNGCILLENCNFADNSILETIGAYAFYNCTSLKEAILPQTVTSISQYAYSNCVSLKKVSVPQSTKAIGYQAFIGCETLSDVTISDYSITKIESNTFKDCPALVSIVLPKGLTTIGSQAFMNDTALVSVTIPESVTAIDSTAFSYPLKTTIYGKAGSYAETFATDGGFTFKDISIPVEGLILKDGVENITLDQGESYRAQFEVYPEDANDVIILTANNSNVTINGHDIYARYSGDTVITATTTSGLTYEFTLHIRSVKNITVTQTPNKTTYVLGEAFDKTGMTVQVNYNDGSSRVVDDYTITGFDSSVEGTNKVTVKWTAANGSTYSTTLEVQIVDLTPKLTDIYVATMPNKLVYEQREKLDLTGMVLKGIYTDGVDREITDFTVSGHNVLKVGTQTITVTVETFTTSFEITVVKPHTHTAGEAVRENETNPDCINAGTYDSVTYCTGCGKELSREAVTVPALGHTEEIIPGKEATATEPGLTVGKKCSVCGEILVAQKEIPATGSVECTHTYSNDYDAVCNNCGEIRQFVEKFVFENYRVVLVDNDTSHKNIRAVIYKLGDTVYTGDPTNEDALKKIDPHAETKWSVKDVNKILLTDAGNYVVLLKYNVGTATVKEPLVINVTADPKLIINKNNKITAIDTNEANINHRVVVYYLGDQTVEDIYDVAALEAIDSEPETIWKIKYINRLALTKGGNYVLHLCYNVGVGAKQIVAQAFTVESIPVLSVDINNKVVVTEENAENKNHRAVVYFLGENTVEDPYDEAAVKAAAVTTSKTYWDLKEINRIEMKLGGNYVIHLYYNVGTSEKRTLALDVTLNERPTLTVDANGKINVSYTDPEINNVRAYIYNVGDAAIADIYDEAALKKIAAPTQVWGLSSINKKTLTPGTYVVHFYYSVGTSAKKTVALKVTI